MPSVDWCRDISSQPSYPSTRDEHSEVFKERFLSRRANAATSRGCRCRGRGSAPRTQTKACTQARVYAVTQQDADAAPDVVTGIISILDHDTYTIVDPGATHSFASKPFLDRFQIETQPLEGRMRVSLPAEDPLFSDRVV